MTDEERQLIQGLADRIRNAPAPQVDRDADNLIRQAIGSRPDALYILTQTVLIQEMALNQAKAQIEQLKAQPPQQPTSFLGNNPPPPPPPPQNAGVSWGGPQRTQPPSGYQASSYRTGYQPPPPPPPQPPPLPQQYVVVEQDPQPSGGRFSGFLHNAAQTAAGVVAGEVAFSALSSIFGHHGGGGGFFGGGGGGYYGSPISPGSETIINNYYEGDRDRGFGGDSGRDRDLESSGLSPDLEDRRFAGDDNPPPDDNQADDDSSDDLTDDSNDDTNDDSGDDSFDDGSSYDDGSGSNDV
jgi:hypothetical protein